MRNIAAHTAFAPSYPPYVSINEVDGGVSITVRAPPITREGCYVCSHAPGPGNCTAGGPTCNNYCNMAPEKGPMQPAPLPCTHTSEGVTATTTLSPEAWAGLKTAIGAS